MIRLGLLVGRAELPLRALVAALARRVTVVDGAAADCDAWLWAPGDPLDPPAGSRVAVWVPEGQSPARPADVRLGTGAAPDPGTWVRVPAEPRDVPQARPFLPFTRARLRAARGLGPGVATGDGQGWHWDGSPVAPALADTVLATAAAVAGTGDAVVPALAWGAPVVTDGATAAAHRLVVGVEVLVAETPDQREQLAREVAAEPRRAAALSRAGRLAYERGSAQAAADRLLAALGAGSPADRVSTLLWSLGTPADALVRTRASRTVPVLESP